MSCESLKNEQNPDIIEEKARLIYEDYISILSPKEVNPRHSFTLAYSLLLHFQVSLDSRVREVINKNMVEPSPHTFDEAQLQIYTLMHRDSYPRFINSQMYRRLLRNEDVKTWLSTSPTRFSFTLLIFFFLSSRHIPPCRRSIVACRRGSSNQTKSSLDERKSNQMPTRSSPLLNQSISIDVYFSTIA